jgi:hypothetical protein
MCGSSVLLLEVFPAAFNYLAGMLSTVHSAIAAASIGSMAC